MTHSDYQYDYTENEVAKANMYDHAGRQYKAKKIIAVLEDHFDDLSNLSILDVSCSTGLITKEFSPFFREISGIDIDQGAIEFAQQECKHENTRFYKMDALSTDFPSESFDVIVCNQMYEHVPDPEKLMHEINRLLVPGGVCYFGATNRLKVIETHYGDLPFLSYLPKPLSHVYLRLLGRGRFYYETLYTYWGLKKLVNQFNIIDYTIKSLSNPEKYYLTNLVKSNTLRQRVIIALSRMLYSLLPGYIWLLEKKQPEI